MTGIYLLFVALIWLALVAWLSKISTRKLSGTGWRIPVGLLMAAVLFPLPLIDEIVGGRQFEQLCKEKAVITVDSDTTQGRTVWFGGSKRTQILLSTIHVTQAKRSFVDAKTQDPIYHYYRFEAKGGWVANLLGISEGGSPLLFNELCQPKNIETIDTKLGLTHINRPTSE